MLGKGKVCESVILGDQNNYVSTDFGKRDARISASPFFSNFFEY